MGGWAGEALWAENWGGDGERDGGGLDAVGCRGGLGGEEGGEGGAGGGGGDEEVEGGEGEGDHHPSMLRFATKTSICSELTLVPSPSVSLRCSTTNSAGMSTSVPGAGTHSLAGACLWGLGTRLLAGL